jgi:hypothetical protein
MRVRLASAIVILGLLGSSIASIAPANALFGLSKCEKAVTSIFEEEQIAMELWTTWNRKRNVLKLKSNHTWNSISGLLNSAIPMIESDNYIYKIMNQNKSCFKSKYLAEARLDYYQNVKNIKAIKDLEREIASGKISGSQVMPKASASTFLKLYVTFLELIEDKHLDKI